MITKNNKVITFTSIIAAVLVMGGAILSASNIKLNVNNLIRGRAGDTISGSITFSRATGTQVVRSNNYYYTSGATTFGGVLYLRNASNQALGNTHVAKMCSSWDKGSVEPEIIFTIADSGTSQFGFQYISSVSAVSDTSTTRTLTVSKSNNGSSWSDAGTLAFTNAGGTSTDVAGAKYVKFTYSGSYTVGITSLTINYYCSPSGNPDVPGAKTLESIAVKTAPSTTSYTEGDYFDPTGLVITATYDDSSTEDVAYSGNEADFSFSPSLSTALTTSDTSVTITYSGKSTLCSIDVSEPEPTPSLTGKYVNDYVYGALTIDFDKLQYSYDRYITNFTYVLSGTTITFTYVAAGSSDSDNSRARLFKPGETTNTGTLSGNKITIKTYNSFGTGTNRDFTK